MLDLRDDALGTAKDALDLSEKDPRATARISSYHKLLSEIYERRGQIAEALMEAENAVKKCENDQFRYELAERVTLLEGMSV